jgi:hypothetical protein
MSDYQSMPIEQLLCVQQVEFAQPVMNQRGVASASGAQCRGRAGDRRYYREVYGSVLDKPLAAEDGTRS